MTNFEIAAERDLPLNDGQARIIFHFLSFVGVIPFVQHTGSEGIRESFARVAQVLFGSNYVKRFTFFCNCLFRKCFRTGQIVSWILDMQFDSFLGISQPRMFVLDYSEIEFQLQVHGCQEVVRLLGLSEEMNSWHSGVKSPKPSSTSRMVLQLISASTLCQNEDEFENFRKLTGFGP